MPIKSIKMKISKNKKKYVSFSCPKDHSTKKLGSQVKRCDLQPANGRTDTHESENRGHPFRVSGVFPSTYDQGSAQQKQVIQWRSCRNLLATFWYMIHEDHTTGHLSVSKIVEVVKFWGNPILIYYYVPLMGLTTRKQLQTQQ